MDRHLALITSANATYSGMYKNRECGYQITDASEISTLSELLLAGFGSKPEPQRWTAEDLAGLKEPVEKLRAALPKSALIVPVGAQAVTHVELKRRDYSRLISSFSGWLQLTLEGVSRIRASTFSMDDVFVASVGIAKERFPENRHVREKLRQQMQRLRDLGLVSFLGHGRYERLASSS